MQTKVYGHDKTLHRTQHVDVQVDNGKVVAVWFRCLPLRFEQHNVDTKDYPGGVLLGASIVAVEYVDDETGIEPE